MERLSEILEAAKKQGVRDILLESDSPPGFHVEGGLAPREGTPVSADWLAGLATGIVSTNAGRARVIAFEGGATVRVLDDGPRPWKDLEYAEEIGERIATLPYGLALIAGPRRSGRSTTLASLVNRINATRDVRIATFEDFIEIQHAPQRATIEQHAGTVVQSKISADVVVIDELRGAAAMRAALRLSDGGALVIAVLEGFDLGQVVNDFVESVRGDGDRGSALAQVGYNLAAVLCGPGPEEAMIVSQGIRNHIVDDHLHVLPARAEEALKWRGAPPAPAESPPPRPAQPPALPDELGFLSELRSGLALIAGPRSSGRTTTLNQIVDKIQKQRNVHVSRSLDLALVQGAHVVCIDELETTADMDRAIRLAENGALVLASMQGHFARGVVQSFSGFEIRLSKVLQAVVCQRLVPTADNQDWVLALEILKRTPAVANVIREHKAHQLTAMIQTGAKWGMRTLSYSLKQLYEANTVTLEAARVALRDESEFWNMFPDAHR